MRRAALVLGLLVACGEAGLQPAEFNDVCGEDGPFRVLELAPGQQLGWGPLAIDDRAVFAVGTAHGINSLGFPHTLTDTELWSIGPCGEAPRRIDTAVDSFKRIDRWPDVVLGIRDDLGEVAVLDVTGTIDEHVVFTGVGPNPYWNDHGLVSFVADSEDEGHAQIHRYPEDPRHDTAAGELLYGPMAFVEGTNSAWPRAVQLVGDELFTLAPDGALISVSLVTGATRIERAHATMLAVSPDGRWILGHDSHDEDTRVGPIFLRDRVHPGELALGDGSISFLYGPFWSYEHGLFAIEDPQQTVRVFDLETLEFVELPQWTALRAILPDGRWLLEATPYREGAYIFDPDSRELTTLSAHGALLTLGDEFLELLDVRPCCIDDMTSFTDEAPLYRINYSGQARKVAARMSRYAARLTDDRWLTAVDIDESALGRLVLADTAARTEVLVDDRVFASSVRVTNTFGDDAVVYSVDDGERSGVWLARPAQ